MRARGRLTDLDRATVRALSHLLPLLPGPGQRRPLTAAEHYALGLALWRMNNPQALPPELRPRWPQ